MNRTTTYPKGCDWCGATGYVSNRNPHPEVTTALTSPCPVCNGSGVVIVTETDSETYEKEFVIWCINSNTKTSPDNIYYAVDNFCGTLGELHEYYQREVKQ